jgi:hypothetical protein
VRKDDNPQVFDERLREYYKKTAPLTGYYYAKKLLHRRRRRHGFDRRRDGPDRGVAEGPQEGRQGESEKVAAPVDSQGCCGRLQLICGRARLSPPHIPIRFGLAALSGQAGFLIGRTRKGRPPPDAGKQQPPATLVQPAHMEMKMARIAGVNIPTNKRVVIALQYIHGIGKKFAQEIVDKVGIPAERRVNQLTDAEVLQIRETIDRDYQVEGDLRREPR